MATKVVFFIDARVQNRDTLIQDMPADSQWFVLDGALDGLDQMRQVLENYSGLDSIQVVSHGASGELWLGNSVLNANTLSTYAAQLGDIGGALAAEGDLLLYGCNVAQGHRGQKFIDTISLMTGADVAASNDFTGAAALGGNWVLEYSAGEIDTRAMVADRYSALLGDTTAPTITEFSPARNATDVSVVPNITLTFNEPIQRGTGNIVITARDMTVATFDAATSTNLSISGSSLTISRDYSLWYGTTYVVKFDAGTIKDLAGNRFAGTDYYFRTVWPDVIDSRRPTVTKFSPSDEATEVNIGANIELTFSEPVEGGAGNIVLKTSEGLSVAFATSFTISSGTGLLTVDPAADLDYGRVYKLEIGSGAIQDISGNVYGGLGDYNFKTAFQPVSVSLSKAVVAETGESNLIYTFTRRGDVSTALSVNIDLSGTAQATDYASNLVLSATEPFDAWTRLLGGAAGDYASAVASDRNGSIYICGGTNNALDGQANNGVRDAFLAKYSSDGNKVWTRLLGTSGDDTATALTTGLDGFIYVSGITMGALDGQRNIGSFDVFLSKYTREGSKVWTQLLGGPQTESVDAITSGLDGSIYVCGRTYSALDGQTNSGGFDAFISKYNTDGTKAWTRLAGGRNNDSAHAIAIGIDGAIYLGGDTSNSLDGQTNSGGQDAFLSKYSTDGIKVWSKLLGGPQDESASAVTVGLDGSIYVGGYTSSALDGQTNNGRFDAFLTKYAPDGTRTWTKVSGTGDTDSISALTTGPDGSIYAGMSTASVKSLIKYSTDGTKIWTKLVDGSTVASGQDGAIYVCGETRNSIDGQPNGGGIDALVAKVVVNSPQITFAAGAAEATLIVDPTPDQIADPDETVVVKVLAGTGYSIGAPASATGTIDGTAPTVSTFSPTFEAKWLPAGKHVVVTFSEPVERGLGNIVLKSSVGLVLATYDAATSTNIALSGGALAILPPSDLEYSSSVKIEIDIGAIKDVAGNSFAGLGLYNVNHVIKDSATNDYLVGTAVDEILLGFDGNDTLTGGLGADTFVVGSGTDTITDLGKGTDVLSVATGATANATVSAAWKATAASVNNGEAYISTNALAVNLAAVTTGTAGYSVTNTGVATTLTGSALADTLTGGVGNDTLVGGLGSDTYMVDSTTDVITELLNGGIDTVISSVTQTTLAANVENLTLAGTADLSATGNTLANVLNGNAGNNTLSGGAGADTMLGGAGNDTYLVDNAGDLAYECTTTTSTIDAGGSDTVQSSVSYALGQFVENLTLTGAAAINATGNALANTLVGNGAANTLNGGAGDDTLTGGLGADTFVVGAGTDTINDLGNGADILSVAAGATANATVYAAWTATAATTNNGGANINTNGLAVSLAAVKNGTAGYNVTNTGSATTLTGSGLADTLTGGSGKDTLNGGLGLDVLVGGTGADLIYGGIDTVKDIFKFNAVSDSTTIARDKIYNFLSGTDKFDFSGIDANSKVAGDQAFKNTSIGIAAKSYSIWATASGADLIISADTDGIASTVEFQVQLIGITKLAYADVVL